MQQQARRLDSVARENEDAPAGEVAGSVGPAETDRRDAAVHAGLDESRRRALVNHGTGGFSPVEVDRGVVFRSHRTNRNAGAAAATGGPAFPGHGIARLGRQPHLVLRTFQSARDDAVEPCARYRRLRKGAGPWRAEVFVRISGYAEFAFGFDIPGLEFSIIDRPVDRAAEIRAHAEIARQVAQAGAEPMPGGAAYGFEVGAFEDIGTGLPVPVAAVQGIGKFGFGQPFIGTFGRLHRCIEKCPECRAAIDPGAGFEHRRADSPRGEPVRQQRAGKTRTDDDDVGFDRGHCPALID